MIQSAPNDFEVEEHSEDQKWWAEACAAIDQRGGDTTTSMPSSGAADNTPVAPVSSTQTGHQATAPHDEFGGAIISIGPNTDAVFDRFQLDDTLLPKLRALTNTVRSSKWESVLRSTKWGLDYEQASKLSSAMIADITKGPLVQVKVRVLLLSNT